MVVRQHEGVEDTRVWQARRIFQPARRPYDQRLTNALQERGERAGNLMRERRRRESRAYARVVLGTKRYVTQVVGFEKRLEDFRAEHDSCRHHDVDAGKATIQVRVREQPNREREAARLAAERAAADACNASALERRRIEVGNCL